MRKILSVIGTRPEAIKMAPVIRALDGAPDVQSLVCVTGQHRSMLDQVLALFRIVPDHDLDIMKPGQTLADITTAVLTGLTRLFAEIKPDRVLVHGDTTTAMAATLAAFYARIPVAHVEAGLRTGDLQQPWPEEMNRKVIDSMADLLFAPTASSATTCCARGWEPPHPGHRQHGHRRAAAHRRPVARRRRPCPRDGRPLPVPVRGQAGDPGHCAPA